MTERSANVKHFPCTLPNFESAKVQLFQVGNRTCIVSYSYFRKLHLCTLVFSIYFRRKITEIDRAVIHPKWLDWNLIRHNFQIWARSPAPLPKTMIENKIMILCSICTLIFVSGGRGDAGPDLCQLRSPRGGRLDGFYSVIQKGLFLGPKKSRKIRHANTGLPSSRFLPRMLFVLK